MSGIMDEVLRREAYIQAKTQYDGGITDHLAWYSDTIRKQSEELVALRAKNQKLRRALRLVQQLSEGGSP